MTAVAPFLMPYIVPLAMISAVATGELWLFRSVAWVWLAVALLDLALPHERSPAARDHSALWHLALRAWVPVQVGVIAGGLLVTNWEGVGARELVAVTISIGVAAGMLCIPVAHELMHSRSRFDRLAADALMLSVSYPHFCIEHVHGHHRRVATAADPASARLGESFYRFYTRTLIGSLESAWLIESSRLRRRRLTVWSPANRMLRYAASLAAVYALIGIGFGSIGVAFFAVQSVIAFSTLEMINYVEHYGLSRRELTPGQFEPVRPCHSWDSAHRFSNWMSFNLGRHADHHCHASKPYQDLHGECDAPQLPTGYFGLFLLPLCPPLWRWVMDARVLAWRQSNDARRTA